MFELVTVNHVLTYVVFTPRTPRFCDFWTKLYAYEHDNILFEFKKSRAPDTSEGSSYPNCGDYVACRYDSDWYIGLVKEICDAEGDIQVRFMHPKGPGKPDNCFFWPSAEDICFIPQHDILCSISAPIPSTKTARKYKVSLFDASQIIQYFEERTCSIQYVRK